MAPYLIFDTLEENKNNLFCCLMEDINIKIQNAFYFSDLGGFQANIGVSL